MTSDSPLLLVFSDDWGRHPSSCQHLMRVLMRKYPVCWVNTIGMRPPRLDRVTLHRGVEKLRQWAVRRGECVAESESPRVINPLMWPWYRRKVDRWINRRLLSRRLAALLASSPQPVIAITSIPIVADLVGPLAVNRWIYYCVDDFSTWPGLDQTALHAMEFDLVGRVDSVVTVSETLQRKIESWGKASLLLTHGVDVDFWARKTAGPDEARIVELERPVFLFWGTVDQRMDMEWLSRLSNDLRQGTILLVGPRQNPHQRLLELRRVVHWPAVPLERLPGLAASCDVLVMPYVDAPVTRAMQPLKLKEYLACPKPVVARSLPAVGEWKDCLDVARSAEEFSALARQRAQSALPQPQLVARRRLQEESWQSKARRFEQFALPSTNEWVTC